MEKNLELLRQFDLEAAKAGTKVYWEGKLGTFVAESKHGKEFAFDFEDYGFAIVGPNCRLDPSNLCMAPLTWVEGRPVYPGDAAFGLHNKHRYTATPEGWIPDDTKHYAPMPFSVDGLTWTPPKVKREGWVNIYPESLVCDTKVHCAFVSHAWRTKELADKFAGLRSGARVACVRIEWEEPAC